MARPMAADEVRRFLLDGTRTAKLATTRADGRPHVAPIWFVLDDDGTVVFTTGRDSVKGRSLRRDPRVALTVDDGTPPYSFVVIEGVAELSDDLDEMLRWATRIGRRYMGEDRAGEFGRRNAVPEEFLVKVRPAMVIAQADVAD